MNAYSELRSQGMRRRYALKVAIQAWTEDHIAPLICHLRPHRWIPVLGKPSEVCGRCYESRDGNPTWQAQAQASSIEAAIKIAEGNR